MKPDRQKWMDILDDRWLLYDICHRPGDFDMNAKLLLDILKAAAAAGVKRVTFPHLAVAGGSCGSLDSHPAFVKAHMAAMEKFAVSASKIKGAPKISFDSTEGPGCVTEAGPDPRFPFGTDPSEVFVRQCQGLARRLAALNCRNVVIGLSGGLDSALALLVSVQVFRSLGHDLAGVHVFTMPGFGTTARTRGNADRLAEGLGVKLETIPITAACRRHFKDIGQPEDRHDVTFENAQARERTQILMDKANQVNGIVVGTGDMSEIALGWCTYNGDHMSMFGVNAGVPKTMVREVCRWWAEIEPHESVSEKKAAEALLDIIATPVSPELLPAKNGEIAQKTEDHVGPYELHDFFLWHFLEKQEDRRQILAAAKKAFSGTYDAKTIEKWLGVFFHRFFAQSFKRNCAPDGVRVYGVYLSPEAWHCPSDIAQVF